MCDVPTTTTQGKVLHTQTGGEETTGLQTRHSYIVTPFSYTTTVISLQQPRQSFV